jgi:hypothetical protein
MKRLILVLALVLASCTVPALAQPAGMTPLEFGRLVNSAEFRPYREQAAVLMARLWQPGEPVSDTWYRDLRTETVALLLWSRAISLPGGAVSSAPADTRCTAIETRWPGLVDKLAR